MGVAILMMATDVNTTQATSSTRKSHCIYKNNPLEHKKLIQNVVQVTRVDGQKLIGTVFTIDPVSESIVLVNICNGKPSLDIIMGHAVCSVEVLSDQTPVPLDNFFPSSNPASSLNDTEVASLRIRLKTWLQKNFLPIEEEGDVLQLANALKIYPPYTSDQCISDNEIILGKVQELILSMPK